MTILKTVLKCTKKLIEEVNAMHETIMTISGIISCIFGLMLVVTGIKKNNSRK